MPITQREFIKLGNETIYAYILDNGTVQAEILNLGGIVTRLLVPDKHGVKTDVLLGYERPEDWLNNGDYFGALIGRCANRLEGGCFALNGQEYQVGINDGGNSLHGGIEGFDKKIWGVTPMDDEEEPSIILTLKSSDGEEGYPGNLKVAVTYTLTRENGLQIHYQAVCDQDTVVNLTNHCYFNLNGQGDILGHILKINADFFTPNDEQCMPTGQIWITKGTPFDFTEPKMVGEDIEDDFSQVQMFSGFDHNFVIRGRGYREAAVLQSPQNGIRMTVMTDEPGMQLYTGNAIDGSKKGKNGASYRPYSALCLETQIFPNAMKHAHYPSPILRAGEKYEYSTCYLFDIAE